MTRAGTRMRRGTCHECGKTCAVTAGGTVIPHQHPDLQWNGRHGQWPSCLGTLKPPREDLNMPIERDLETGPRQSTSRKDGYPPDTEPDLTPIIGAALAELAHRKPKTKPRDYIRPSDAMSCARKLSYVALGYSGTEMDAPGNLTVLLGNLIHKWLGEILTDVGRVGLRCETCDGEGQVASDMQNDELVACDICDGKGRTFPELTRLEIAIEEPIGIPPPKKSPTPIADDSALASATVDDAAPEDADVDPIPYELELTDPRTSEPVVVKIYGFNDLRLGRDSVTDFKSAGGTKLKKKLGDRVAAEGPDLAHIIQPAIGAIVMLCQRVRVLYIGKEAVSIPLAKKRGIKELDRIIPQWTYELADIREMVEAEIIRMWKINRRALDPYEDDLHTADGVLARRLIPGVPAEIESPDKGGAWTLRGPDGALQNSGTAWNCDYCSMRDHCVADGPGPVLINPRPKATTTNEETTST